MKLSYDEINGILENSSKARQLHTAIHQIMKTPEITDRSKVSKYTKKGFKRFRN